MDKISKCAERCRQKYDCKNSFKKDIVAMSKVATANNCVNIIEKERCFKNLLDCWEDCGFRDLTYNLYD